VMVDNIAFFTIFLLFLAAAVNIMDKLLFFIFI